MSKQDIYQFEQSYQYVILCCQDDYYNLLMNYRIQRDMFNTHVYALCGEQNYIELYSDNIDIFQKKEDIERVIKKLYDQKKNKCWDHSIRLCSCYFDWNVFTFNAMGKWTYWFFRCFVYSDECNLCNWIGCVWYSDALDTLWSDCYFDFDSNWGLGFYHDWCFSSNLSEEKN